MTQPRGIRGHNPLNIKRGSNWIGLAPVQSDDTFCTFTTPEYGIRAAAKLLQTYQEKYQLMTLRQIIDRWAPPSENDTSAYITAVSIWADFDPDAVIDVTDYATAYPLMRAMCRQENGAPPEDTEPYWYQPEVWERGLRMAGVMPSKALRDSRTMKGTIAAASSSIVALGTLLDQFGLPKEITDLLPVALSGVSEQTVAAVAIVVAIAGSLYAAWSRRDDAKWGRL